MRIVGSGLSGLIGNVLTVQLKKKYELVVLARETKEPKRSSDSRRIVWHPPMLGDWIQEIDSAYAVINLAGEPIAGKRWTAAQKKELRDSRFQTTKALVDAIGRAKDKPKVFINASAIGYYGSRDSAALDESATPGTGFLSELCQEWEKEALRAKSFGVRTVLLRTGIVLAREGGALVKMLPPFKMGIGGPLGNGKQVMSWIHIEDAVGGILKVLEDPSIEGPVNLTAPQAVPMREFADALGRALKRPVFFPVPGIALRLLLGEMSAMLLTGQNIRPGVLTRAGYSFKYPALEDALKDLLQTTF